ncbi:MAG: hypothetical protein BGO37_08970 [Cellulomonas sp. 73-92]|nr:MAG: hypothetical protein BGO37_08970 [Cellulomonas sp. 73-92]
MSIVCVFNDPAVRSSCLDRSIAAGLSDAPDTEYIPVDNTRGQFRSAGAALNAGAAESRRRVVAFVHQDVYLHDLVALERAAAALLDDPRIGLVGAVGITDTGAVLGRVRDRVVMIGQPTSESQDVDSVDEVLFLVDRDRVVADPLSEHPDLAWHAYAVEYGARMRSAGLRVVAHDLALTHNSLTVNLARLDEAHRHVAAIYPALLPMRTTCGVVRPRGQDGPIRTALRRRRGVATWWRESLRARRLARAAGRSTHDMILGDIRLAIDEALETIDAASLHVVNLGNSALEGGRWSVDGLPRLGRTVSAEVGRSVDYGWFSAVAGRAVLVTGIDEGAVGGLAPLLADTPHLLGLAEDTGAWLLVHPAAARVRAQWRTRRSAPFGRRPATATTTTPTARPAPVAG